VLNLTNLGTSGSSIYDVGSTFRLRKLVAQLSLSQALFHPTSRLPVRGSERMFPSPEQLKPMNALSMPWLWSLTNGDENFEQLTRSTLFVADEGGMGKTYSCAIALNWLKKEKSGNILIVCPPTLKYTWKSCIEKFGFKPNYLSATDYREGNLSEGFNIISSFSVAKAPLYPQVQEKYRRNLIAVLLDEAHNGMPADNVHAGSFNSLLSTANVRIMISATPMRTGITDLFSLLRATCANTEDAQIAEVLQEKFEANEDLILNQWIPILNRMKSDEHTENDLRFLKTNWGEVIPLTSNESEAFEGYFNTLENAISAMTEDERVLLAQDLHPLGRFLSCTLRDDLGQDVCAHLYREMFSKAIPYTLSEDYLNEIEQIGLLIEGEPNTKVLESCLLNVHKPNYVSFEGIELSDELSEQCTQAWQNDTRIECIIQVLQEEYERKSSPENHHAHAVIIFCDYIGTIQLLESTLSGLTEELEFQLDVHTPTLSEDEEEDSYNSNARRISSQLFQIGRAARTSNHLQVVICGKAVAEGHSLNWATHIVHWDMPVHQSEVIAQRNWRLDRRISNDWERHNYSNQFRITYLINTQRDRRVELNSHYSRNRRFLGHRGHIQHPDENLLIPTIDNEWVLREWTPEPQNCMGTNSFQVQRLFDYLDGNIADHDGLASAFLNRSILELLAIHPHGMDSIYNDGIEFRGHLGFDPDVYNILLRIASIDERVELGRLGPQLKPSKLISRWGLPGGDGVLFSVEPSGRLSTTLLDLSLKNAQFNSAFEDEDFPFTFNGTGMSLVIHTGILRILASRAGNALRTYWRERMPTAFFVRDSYDSDEPYRNLTLTEIENPEFLEKFQIMSEDNPVRLPLEDYVFNRQEHIELMDDYRELLRPQDSDPNGNAGANALVEFLKASSAIDNLELLEPSPEMLIPIYRHSSRRYPQDASTMYLKMNKPNSNRENTHSHGWW